MHHNIKRVHVAESVIRQLIQLTEERDFGKLIDNALMVYLICVRLRQKGFTLNAISTERIPEQRELADLSKLNAIVEGIQGRHS